jgi:hypothetical protein
MRATISATLTSEAYRVYQQWALQRKASDEISRAMVESYARESLIQALTAQRNIYRNRSGSFKRLIEEIDAGLYHDVEEIKKHMIRVFEKFPFGGEEQITLEEF